MKFFSPEGRDCSKEDAHALQVALRAFLSNGDTDTLKDLGSLTISFEGDARQVGFFHRYDVSCSTTYVPTPNDSDGSSGMSMFKTREDPDLTPCIGCIAGCFEKQGNGDPPCANWTPKSFDNFKSLITSARFSRGSVKLDGVRIGLLGGVVILFILLIASLLRGGSGAYQG
jgi:hypothetical protein